jgi:hypothetical protein
VFFAQEAFFGEAIHTLGEFFDVAICKDDYLNYFYSLDFQRPCFKAGDMKVVVASGHILNESLERLRRDPDALGKQKLCDARYVEHIRRAAQLNDGRNFPARCGRDGNVSWCWYHCGDGNHFCATDKPQDLERCYYDPGWERWCTAILEDLEHDGYELLQIGEFTKRLDYSKAVELPLLIEGSWNSSVSGGVGAWMGDHRSASADHDTLLACVSRGRQRIVDIEAAMSAQRAEPSGGSELKVRPRLLRRALERVASRVAVGNGESELTLAKAWDSLFEAEVSDAFGWQPSSEAVAQGFANAQQTLSIAAEIQDRLWRPSAAVTGSSNCKAVVELEVDGTGVCRLSEPLPELVILGAKGAVSMEFVSPRQAACEVSFSPVDTECGVAVKFDLAYVFYSPAGLECAPVLLDLEALKPNVVVLPLSNGLVQVSESTFLIKELASVHLAATIDRSQKLLKFVVRNGRQKSRYIWRFHLWQGTRSAAVEFANQLNGTCCPTCGDGSTRCRTRAAADFEGFGRLTVSEREVELRSCR